MVKYTLKRVGLALVTLLLIVFLLFVMVRIMPGNPFPSERMSAEAIAAKRAEMGLDDPILVQFARYMSNLLRGDFGRGTSLYNGAPIKTVLGAAISNSFRIGGIAILAGTLVGLLLGAGAVAAAQYANVTLLLTALWLLLGLLRRDEAPCCGQHT